MTLIEAKGYILDIVEFLQLNGIEIVIDLSSAWSVSTAKNCLPREEWMNITIYNFEPSYIIDNIEAIIACKGIILPIIVFEDSKVWMLDWRFKVR